MCDFFSAIILADGRVFHDETNSHSKLREKHRVRENTPARLNYWEFEWNGAGEYRPEKHLRNFQEAPEEASLAAEKLAKELAEAFQGRFSLRMKGFQDVRREVAWNPNMSGETLALLAKDKDAGVRCGVARNPNTSGETLALLAKDRDAGVRRSAAR